ncbi:IPT/TIG domain-containing protein [Streptomyces sp. NRRL WC-3618]|uniref:IPT/TIG domain-containing protein n=1 Tax=Streptomyces sp. NRRL WC-3618 TaxID=1519490 RepID=UPI00099CEFA1
MKEKSIVFAALATTIGLIALLFPAGAVAAGEAISVSPATGPAGSAVTISGTGWEEHGSRELSVSITMDGTPVATAHPSKSGTFRVHATVPKSASGTVKISAIIGNGGAAYATFKVGAKRAGCPTNTQIASIPGAGSVGSKFLQKGSGWLPGGVVHVVLPHGSKALFLSISGGAARVGSGGGWQKVVTVGKGTPHGHYTYTATESAPKCPSGKITKTGSFTVR